MVMPARLGLVADDDAYFRIAVGTILTWQFAFGLEASSLARLAASDGPCAALLDLSMPGMRTAALTGAASDR